MKTTLSETQMFDYIFCPCKFHMKHVMGIALEDPISLPRLLNKVAKYFFMSLLNGKVPSTNELKNKWDSICNKYPDFIDAKKNIAGWGLILSMAQWASREKIIVGDVNQNYKMLFGITELTGSIDTILVNQDKKIELLYLNFSGQDPEKFDLDTKLKYTLDSAAFLAMHGRAVDGIRVHNVKSGKDFFSYRTEPDYQRLSTTIIKVAAGIQQEIYYPRESGMCASCTGKQTCKYWSL